MFELHPINGRKSFYGKAIVKKENGVLTLFSYCTPVAVCDNGQVRELEYGHHSRTTNTHIEAFKAYCGC